MIAVLLESAIRTLALAAIVWFALKAFRFRGAHADLIAWRSVLLAAMLMPLLMVAASTGQPALVIEPAAEFPRAAQVATGSAAWPTVLLVAYVCIASLLMIGQQRALLKGWQLRRRAMRAEESWTQGSDVRFSKEITVPATFATTILLPESARSWRTPKRSAVLAHERAHVRNRDFFVQVLAQLHRAVFWFNPLAWWLPRKLSLAAEYLSDDAALSAMPDCTAYAELLLEFAKTSRPSALAPSIGESPIANRIARVLEGGSPVAQPSRMRRVIAMAALLVFVMATAAFSIERSARCIESPLTQPPELCVPPKSNRLTPLSQPKYPAAARRLGEQGTVVLELRVLDDGSVDKVRVKRSSGFPRLDQSAAEEARNWRMSPGTVGGDAVPSWGSFAVTFKLTH